MTSLKISKFDFSATISNINAQFAPMNKGLNFASIRLQQLFGKYFQYVRITPLNFSKFNFSRCYKQYLCAVCASEKRTLFCIFHVPITFRKYFLYARIASLKISKFNFSAAISNIYAHVAPVNRGLN